MSVLVIDDHPIVIQGCRRMLEDLGVSEVHVASSLAEGFRLYRQKRPEMIIVDLSMQSGALGGLSFIRPRSSGGLGTFLVAGPDASGFQFHLTSRIVAQFGNLDRIGAWSVCSAPIGRTMCFLRRKPA